MENIPWKDKARNEKVVERVREKRKIFEIIKKRKQKWADWLRKRGLLIDVLEGMVEATEEEGAYQLLDNIKLARIYEKMMRTSEDRQTWWADVPKPAFE